LKPPWDVCAPPPWDEPKGDWPPVLPKGEGLFVDWEPPPPPPKLKGEACCGVGLKLLEPKGELPPDAELPKGLWLLWAMGWPRFMPLEPPKGPLLLPEEEDWAPLEPPMDPLEDD
jgi:hypothetical protein